MVVAFSGSSAPTWDATQLVEAARGGDAVAWEQLFMEHYPRLFRFFRGRAESAQAEDLASSVFLQAFRSIQSFSWQGKPFESWLFGIARRELASHYRALHPFTPPVPADSPDEFLEVEIGDILDRLPSHYRQAIELRYVLGLSGLEAAAAMGRTHGSFRSLLLRAVRAYREQADSGAECDRAAPPRRHLASDASDGCRA